MENSSEQNDGQKLNEATEQAQQAQQAVQEYLKELVQLNLKHRVGSQLPIHPVALAAHMMQAVSNLQIVISSSIHIQRAEKEQANANSSQV